MNRGELLLLIDQLLELEPGTLKGPEMLVDNGWDSLAIVSFIALVDEHFGFTVPATALMKCKTADDLVALVERTSSASASTAGD